jgi:puromycin-sensitive aminopeptidase
VLNLLKAYVDEEDYTVWTAINSVVDTLQSLLNFTDFSQTFRPFVTNLYAPLKEKLGWEAKEAEGNGTPLLPNQGPPLTNNH